MFGSNGHISQPESIRHSFVTRESYANLRTINGKCITRTNALSHINLHQSILRNINGLVITSDGNQQTQVDKNFVNISEEILENSCLHLNHYAIQSWEWFSNVKMTRGAADSQYCDNIRNESYFKAYDYNVVFDDSIKYNMLNKYFSEIDCTIENVCEKHINSNYRYIDIDFDNNGNQGLFNKIIYLSGVVRFCLKNNNIRLVEPLYKIGVNHHTLDNKGILFSDIFDIDFFNKKMENIFYMIPKKDISKYNLNVEILPHDYANIYGWNIEHGEYIDVATNMNKISIDDNILLKILDALKLNNANLMLLKKELEILCDNYNAIHMRIENDWPGPWNKINSNQIIDLYKKSNIYDRNNSMFFSTGESHNEIRQSFNNINVKNHTFESEHLLYDLKTAISYTICLLSNTFISHTYSTFSSLITMQRELIYKNANNYSYNPNSIYKRLDKGLNYKKTTETGKDASTYVEVVNILPI